MKRIMCLLLLIVAAQGLAGCSNPFSMKPAMDEANQILTDTYNLAASGTIPLPPLEP